MNYKRHKLVHKWIGIIIAIVLLSRISTPVLIDATTEAFKIILVALIAAIIIVLQAFLICFVTYAFYSYFCDVYEETQTTRWFWKSKEDLGVLYISATAISAALVLISLLV